MDNTLVINKIHAIIDAHGVRIGCKLDGNGKAIGHEAAQALADSKRGKVDEYRLSILAMLTTLVRVPLVDASKAGRKAHVAAGLPTFSVDAAALFPEAAAAQHVKKWNDDSALTRWLNDNAGKVLEGCEVVKLRKDKHEFYLFVK